MSCRIAFISPEELIKWVDVALVVDADKITRDIIIAQERYIKPVLCKDLYEEISTQIESGSITSDFQDLIHALTPTLAFRFYSRYLNTANMDSTEKGMRQWNEDNSEGISDRRLQSIISQADQDAMSYEQELKIFLKTNRECFLPFYDGCDCGLDSPSSFKISMIGSSSRKPRIQETFTQNLLDNQ